MQIWCHLSSSTSRALQRWSIVESYSRSTTEQTVEMLMWARCEALAEEAWTGESSSRSPAFLPSFSSMWNHSSSHSLSISCPFSQAHPKHPLPWNHPALISTCWVPKALFTSLIFHEGPSYSVSSFVHMHTASLSSWGARSAHHALCWALTLIISNPHNKLTGSPGSILQMRKLRLSEVISLVCERSAVKQKSWNLNKIMSLWTTS